MSRTAAAAVPMPVASARRDSPAWWQFLRRELAPTPGRSARTLQIIASIVIVQLISMSIQIPNASVSCFVALLLIRENRLVSMFASVLIAVAMILAVATTIFSYHYTFDHPELRIPFTALITFSAMWFSRTCSLGPLGFAFGFLVAFIQLVADGVPFAEMSVRSSLWATVALCYPAFVVNAVGAVVFPINARDSVIEGIVERLDFALDTLRAVIRQEAPDRAKIRDFLDRATHGSALLLKELGNAEKEAPRWKGHHADLTAAITASEQVAVCAAALPLRASPVLSESDRSGARLLLAEIACLKKALRRRRRPGPRPAGAEAPADSARLREFQLAAADLRDSLAGSPLALASPKPEKKPFFKPDAFTNPEHVHFALKVTLAAMTCYFLFTAFDWSGTRTAFSTCCIIALETAGATSHKGTLRITGCLLGALTGFLCVLYGLPHMTGITELLLVSAFGASIGGWIVSGSDRTSYAGAQFTYAFFICIDQGYGPKVDLEPIRDRIMGILMGLTVSALVYNHLWPEHTADKLREVFARALRGIGQLLKHTPAGEETRPPRDDREPKPPGEQYESAIADLAQTQQLLDVANFEDYDERTAVRLASAHPRAMVRHTQSICLVAGQLLGRAQKDGWQALGQEGRAEDARAREAAAEVLARVADFVERGGRAPAARAEEERASSPESSDRASLQRRLLEECALLTENCRAITRV